MVYDPSRPVTTQETVPLLDPTGATVPGATLAGAVTVDLDSAEITRNNSRRLWVQGGTLTDPLNATTLPGPNGVGSKYGFGALRCATDNWNGDNVEWIGFPTNTSHVFCYYYAVTPAPTPGTIIVQKTLAQPDTATHTFRFLGNISYSPNPYPSQDSGYFDLKVVDGKAGAISFDRAAVPPAASRGPSRSRRRPAGSWTGSIARARKAAAARSSSRAERRPSSSPAVTR